jgi:hypothetical protein
VLRRWIQAVSVFLSASFLFLGRQKKTLLPPGIHVLILCWSGLQALKDQRIRTTTIGHLLRPRPTDVTSGCWRLQGADAAGLYPAVRRLRP